MRKNIVYKPHKLLALFIEAFVVTYSRNSNKQNHFNPSNQPILCFDLNKKHFKESGTINDFNFSLGLVGVLDHFVHLDKVPKKSIQVIFKPYGAFYFFKTPMLNFVNNGIDIESILPNLTGCIHRLEDAYHNNLESIKILEQFLLKQLRLTHNECSNFDRIQFACES